MSAHFECTKVRTAPLGFLGHKRGTWVCVHLVDEGLRTQMRGAVAAVAAG